MKPLLRRRPSPALVISLIALFVSLSGVSYGVATGFIDSREIKNNEIRSLDIRNNEVRTRDLRNNEVRGIDIRNSTIQGRDIGLNQVTGEDVKEDTLQKVPSALLADTATKATTAGSADAAKTLDSLKIFPRTTLDEGAQPATLATHGPLTLSAECVSSMTGTELRVSIATTEIDTTIGGRRLITTEQTLPANPDLDPGAPKQVLVYPDDAGGTRTLSAGRLWATAAGGKGFAGDISAVIDANAGTSGTCAFQGHVLLYG